MRRSGSNYTEATDTTKRGKTEKVCSDPRCLTWSDIGRAAALVTGSRRGFGVNDDSEDSDEWGGLMLGEDSDADMPDDDDEGTGAPQPSKRNGSRASVIKNDPD
eukprot:299237-Pyramimonas_sp.AAC.1